MLEGDSKTLECEECFGFITACQRSVVAGLQEGLYAEQTGFFDE